MEIKLGEFYSIHPDEHALGCIRRRLIWRNNLPIGHWSDGCYIGGGYLWLQNYSGYYHWSQFIHFQKVEFAIDYVKKRLKEQEQWDK